MTIVNPSPRFIKIWVKGQIFSLSLDFLEKCGNVFSINEKKFINFSANYCAKLNIENKGYVMPKRYYRVNLILKSLVEIWKNMDSE